jgi:hypothetical protein
MKKIILISLILASAAARAQAATVTVGPSDCSAATVNSAISASSTHDGDTVLLTCTGPITWTATVTIPSTKGITLEVQGGTNTPKTSANFPLIVTSSQSPAILVNIGPNNSPSRVSGFRFAPNTGTPDPFFEVTGQGNGKAGIGGFRLDNNYFDTISGNRMLAIWSKGGNLFGLIDNNTFHNTYRADNTAYGPYNIQVWNYWKPSSPSNQCWGCDGWTNNDFVYGSEKFVFIEDNLFEQTASAPAHMRHYISSELGARYVSRYNTFINNFPDTNADLHDAHGLCIVSSNGAGSRGGEIYNNTIQGTGYDRGIIMRGGSWVIHDNVITAGGGNPIEFDEYRAQTSSSCDTNNALGLMPPWPVPTGAKWNPNAPWISYVTAGSAYQLPQQIFNTFVWNNTSPGGALINPAVPSGTLEQTYIQNNRDYFAAATQPSGLSGYTPYTYPHPLRGGGVSGAPAPPTGLAASVN